MMHLPPAYRDSRLLRVVLLLRRVIVPLSPLCLIALVSPNLRGIEVGGIARHLQMFGFAFFGAALLTPGIGWLSRRVGALDHPDPRKKHAVATPVLGGLAVFIAYFAAMAVRPEFSREMNGILIGGWVILVVGIVDDVVRGGIPAKLRFLAHAAAAGVAIYFGVKLDLFPFTPWGRIISIVLSVFWIVGIINAINFLDGMDGLAAGLAAAASGSFFIIGYRLNDPYLGFVSIALCGASIGFLLHNFKPAAIFLGDNGATFISFSVPIMVLGIPIFDMIYTTAERFASGKVRTFGQWLAYTGRDHFHHRLADHGFLDYQAVLFIYFINLTLGLVAAVIATTTSAITLGLLLAQGVCIFLIITILMYFVRKTDNGAEGG